MHKSTRENDATACIGQMHVSVYSYLVPEREQFCPSTSMQLLSTNTTSDDNLPAMSVDCGGPVLSKVHVGQTPPTRNNGECVQLHPCEFEFSDLIVACMGP